MVSSCTVVFWIFLLNATFQTLIINLGLKKTAKFPLTALIVKSIFPNSFTPPIAQ